jgi:hypothetical protein
MLGKADDLFDAIENFEDTEIEALAHNILSLAARVRELRNMEKE